MAIGNYIMVWAHFGPQPSNLSCRGLSRPFLLAYTGAPRAVAGARYDARDEM